MGTRRDVVPDRECLRGVDLKEGSDIGRLVLFLHRAGPPLSRGTHT